MDLDHVAAQLGVPVADVERVHRLAGDLPSAPLPDKAGAPALLERLAVRPDDAAEIMAGWPDPGSPLWTPELRWLLDRSTALVRADLGGHEWLAPGPELPRERGPAWCHLYAYACLALTGVVLDYHRAHAIPEAVSWTTLADLGRNLAIDRRMHREGWPVMQSWLTLHVRGALYELGRLQHHRGTTAVSLHIPEAGPLTPEAIDASLDQARAFFPRHFPDERYEAFACGSWLLDPQLREYLPEDSNIIRFQRRFELEPYEEPEGLDADVEVLRFVFRSLTTPLDRLPRRTALQRAVGDHLRAGRHWQWRQGRIPANFSSRSRVERA
ncbi:acyltransferase domain-containing protein [Symbioplanes lichenis]|uniref:acyltransferase domain-containing protein n=1 Tax=Symbioplanes lichenis TaxID=1629072 RepID=UPI002739A1F6|nr:acyltransferase domain-containing protein [Actinoplanes lichenis]